MIQKTENNDIKSRLLLFVKHLGLGQNAFEKQTGLSVGYIANIQKTIGADKLLKIINKYPELNLMWLVSGEGEMLNTLIGHRQAGHHNQINNSPINIDTENQRLKEENEFLKARLQDKEEIINLLKTNKK